ncbi:flagellar biosynthesis anti-sigma factor FlgM [Oscillospiraceae bacterium CM]|nr:flagellar biosynthesis anti-sigma factor FlgM [Oscillospiraceae bacterium CM]
MKINSVSQNDAISKYVHTINSKPTPAAVKTGINDSVELSEGAQKYAALLKAAKDSIDSPGAEEAKAADIMARMNNNSYNVPTGDVVGSIMSGIPTHI